MIKQKAKLQRRKAKKLARVLAKLSPEKFIYTDSIFAPGDGVMALEIGIYWNDKWYYASGGAKCNRVDHWNESVGVEIATGRALLRIAYQILKDEQLKEARSIEQEVMEDFKEFQALLGIEIYVDKSPNLDKTAWGESLRPGTPEDQVGHGSTEPLITHVPGSAKYRGDNEQHGYGVIKPEYVPSGLEVIKQKEAEDAQKNEQPVSGPGTGEGQ